MTRQGRNGSASLKTCTRKAFRKQKLKKAVNKVKVGPDRAPKLRDTGSCEIAYRELKHVARNCLPHTASAAGLTITSLLCSTPVGHSSKSRRALCSLPDGSGGVKPRKRPHDPPKSDAGPLKHWILYSPVRCLCRRFLRFEDAVFGFSSRDARPLRGCIDGELGS